MSSISEDTNIAEQRKLGVKLAKTFNAPKTLEAIKEKTSTLEEIFKIAADEVGIEKLVEIVVDERPEWAFWLKRSVPLGALEAPVSKRAGELALPAEEAISDAVANAKQVLQPVSRVSLGLQGGVGGAAYQCWFTMMWQSAQNVNQPIAAYPNTSDWLWSPLVGVQRPAMMNCVDFANHAPNSPLKAGDPVWLMITICAGTTVYAGGSLQAFQYKYDPNANATLALTGTGTTFNPIFKRSP